MQRANVVASKPCLTSAQSLPLPLRLRGLKEPLSLKNPTLSDGCWRGGGASGGATMKMRSTNGSHVPSLKLIWREGAHASDSLFGGGGGQLTGTREDGPRGPRKSEDGGGPAES